MKPGMDPSMGAMGVEVWSGPGSNASSPCFSVDFNVCPEEAGDGMGRELGAVAAVVPTDVLMVRGSGLGPCLEPFSSAGLEPWARSLLWEEGELTAPEVLASRRGEAGI